MANVTYSCAISIGGQTPVNLQMMNNQFDNVTISGGSDGFDQPQPTTANIQFLNPVFGGVQILPAQLVGQPIQINTTYTLSGSSYTNNFYGIVQTASMTPVDATATNNVLEINAVSQMALYTRKLANRLGYAAETESARMTSIGNDLGDFWQDINASIIWDDYPTSLQWVDFDDMPWGYQYGILFAGNPRNLIATTANATNALSYVQTLADGNSAWTHDAGLSGLGYAPLSYWAGRTPTTLNASTSVVFQNIGTQLDMADRYNSATVSNGTTSASAANVSDIVQNGEYALSVTSDLNDFSDLQATANFKLAGHTLGVRPITQITVDLDTITSEVDAASLASIQFPRNLILNNMPSIYMPTGLNPEKWQSRGGTLNFSTNHSEVTLNIVPYAVYYTGTVTWQSVSSSDTWATYLTSTTTWADVA